MSTDRSVKLEWTKRSQITLFQDEYSRLRLSRMIGQVETYHHTNEPPFVHPHYPNHQKVYLYLNPSEEALLVSFSGFLDIFVLENDALATLLEIVTLTLLDEFQGNCRKIALGQYSAITSMFSTCFNTRCHKTNFSSVIIACMSRYLEQH